MATMTTASLISPNVFLGPTPDSSNPTHLNGCPVNNTIFEDYDVLIESSDMARFPGRLLLEKLKDNMRENPGQIIQLDVPGSGTISIPDRESQPMINKSDEEVEALLGVCKWIWDVSRGDEQEKAEEQGLEVKQAEEDKPALSNGVVINGPTEAVLQDKVLDSDGDIIMSEETANATSPSAPPAVAAPIPALPVSLAPPLILKEELDKRQMEAERNKKPLPPKRILIHCPDGYTESSLLALAYLMYSHGKTVGEAWIDMHVEKGRNFFAYPTDVGVLLGMQDRILQASPIKKEKAEPLEEQKEVETNEEAIVESADPVWLTPSFDGSLPSRVLPHLYLGNLVHAQCPSMLKQLGIKRIVTVGERIDWQQWSRMLDTTSNGQSTFGTNIRNEIDDLEERGKPSVREEIHDGFHFLMIGPGVLADNGVDGLMGEFQRCIDFIGEWFDTWRCILL
jgi:hypothetical protein